MSELDTVVAHWALGELSTEGAVAAVLSSLGSAFVVGPTAELLAGRDERGVGRRVAAGQRVAGFVSAPLQEVSAMLVVAGAPAPDVLMPCARALAVILARAARADEAQKSAHALGNLAAAITSNLDYANELVDKKDAELLRALGYAREAARNMPPSLARFVEVLKS